MYKIFSIALIILSIGYSLPSFGQGEGDILYDKEVVVGVNFNTNGGLIGGGMLRYSKKISDANFYQFALELNFIKNPKELRYLNITTNNTFIAFKLNDMFVLRPQIGYEHVLFRKAEEDGVQIDLILAGGLSFGFLKPYYIQYLYGTEIKDEAYDPAVHQDFNRIQGSSGAFMGLGESKVVPGLHIKPALSFEMGHMNGNVTGVEIGALLEAFTEKMIILEPYTGLPPIENKQVFTSVYLTVYFGFRN